MIIIGTLILLGAGGYVALIGISGIIGEWVESRKRTNY